MQRWNKKKGRVFLGSQSNFGTTREVLQSVVALHERDLALPDHMPLPGHSIFSIHQEIRHFAASLAGAGASSWQGSLQMLVKGEGEPYYLRLALAYREALVRDMELDLVEKTVDGLSPFKVGIFVVAHHGVEAYFGRFANFQNVQEPVAFIMSMQQQVNERYRLVWRGMRWICANLLVWEDPHLLYLPHDLDGLSL